MKKRCVLLVLLLTLVRAQVTVTLDPESFVEYEASDVNATWTGQASVSRLEFSLNPERLSSSSLTIVVNSGDFNSGNIFRDTNARRTVFESSTYPEIVFVSKQIRADVDTLADGESREVTLAGDLTMHGVTQELETVATVSLMGNTVTATGSFEVNYTDFGMRQPTLFAVIVSPTVIIRFNFSGEM
jgi:polyisoprenoid-binding protein YceI